MSMIAPRTASRVALEDRKLSPPQASRNREFNVSESSVYNPVIPKLKGAPVNIVRLITASLVLAGTAAVAQKVHYTATLVQPLTGTKEIVANDNLWSCAGSTCTLVSEPRSPNSLGACHALKRKMGALSAYGLADSLFDADKLAKCNAG
jgi:hypothetical protein